MTCTPKTQYVPIDIAIFWEALLETIKQPWIVLLHVAINETGAICISPRVPHHLLYIISKSLWSLIGILEYFALYFISLTVQYMWCFICLVRHVGEGLLTFSETPNLVFSSWVRFIWQYIQTSSTIFLLKHLDSHWSTKLLPWASMVIRTCAQCIISVPLTYQWYIYASILFSMISQHWHSCLDIMDAIYSKISTQQ